MPKPLYYGPNNTEGVAIDLFMAGASVWESGKILGASGSSEGVIRDSIRCLEAAVVSPELESSGISIRGKVSA